MKSQNESYRHTSRHFLGAGQVSWNRGTSKNTSCTIHKRRAPQGKMFLFLLQDILKTAFKMRIELIDAHRQSNVFQNQGAICLFSKAIGETSHPSPFQLQAEVNLFSLKRLRQHLFFLYGNDQVQQKFTFDFKKPSFIWLVAILV